MPNRNIFRSLSFNTLGDSPGQARRIALGRRAPRAMSTRSRTDHLQPTMLSTIEATEIEPEDFTSGAALGEALRGTKG